MRNIKIGKRVIGESSPAYIIAEAGSNHNGDLKTAFKLVDIAKEAGADAVKFQSVSFDTLTSESNNSTLKEAVDKITLTRNWYSELSEYCSKSEIDFMSTPTYEQAVDDLYDFNVPAFKIASMDLTNLPLLRYVARKKRPIIISRGMSFLSEIDTAIRCIQQEGNHDIILLHCIAQYPTPADQVHLKSMQTLQQCFDIPVGYSDHTEGEGVPSAAVALGAKVIEKHFTYDRSIKGFDHFYAADPQTLTRMIKCIRDTEASLGVPQVTVHETELEPKRLYQRSIVVKEDIKEGDVFSEKNITTKRPGSGLHPGQWDYIIGRKAKHSFTKDHILQEREV